MLIRIFVYRLVICSLEKKHLFSISLRLCGVKKKLSRCPAHHVVNLISNYDFFNIFRFFWKSISSFGNEGFFCLLLNYLFCMLLLLNVPVVVVWIPWYALALDTPLVEYIRTLNWDWMLWLKSGIVNGYVIHLLLLIFL